jgi:hypothetical protein
MYEEVNAAEPINEALPAASKSNGKAPYAQPQARTTAPSSTTPLNPAPTTGLAAKLRKKRAAAQDNKDKQGRGEHQQTVVPVRTPDRQWWFRCHRDPAMSVPVDLLIIRSGPDEGAYLRIGKNSVRRLRSERCDGNGLYLTVNIRSQRSSNNLRVGVKHIVMLNESDHSCLREFLNLPESAY